MKIDEAVKRVVFLVEEAEDPDKIEDAITTLLPKLDAESVRALVIEGLAERVNEELRKRGYPVAVAREEKGRTTVAIYRRGRKKKKTVVH